MSKGVIQTKLNAKQIDLLFTQKNEEIQKKTIYYLNYLGESCLREMRTNYSYMDDTGNLTASMGYIVLHNGVPFANGGFNVGQNKNNVIGTDSEGPIKGKEFINSLMQKYANINYCLIVVAGMSYASYVAKYRNVTQSAELLAQRQMPLIIKKIFQ